MVPGSRERLNPIGSGFRERLEIALCKVSITLRVANRRFASSRVHSFAEVPGTRVTTVSLGLCSLAVKCQGHRDLWGQPNRLSRSAAERQSTC